MFGTKADAICAGQAGRDVIRCSTGDASPPGQPPSLGSECPGGHDDDPGSDIRLLRPPQGYRMQGTLMPNKDYEKRVESTEAERIAIAAAKLATTDAINELFAAFGINCSNVAAMDELRNDLRFVRRLRNRKDIYDDLAFLSNIRSGSAKAGSRFILALVTIMAGGFAWGMLQAAKAWISVLVGKPIH